MPKKIELSGLLSALSDDNAEDNPELTPLQKAGLAATLKDRYQKLQEQHTFRPGDLVQWKPGLQHKTGDGPFIITEVLAEPLISDDAGPGSTYFREQMDVKAAEISSRGNHFAEFHFDSRRFEPYTGETIETI